MFYIYPQFASAYISNVMNNRMIIDIFNIDNSNIAYIKTKNC